MSSLIAIIDYGMGNIHSVKKALEEKGARTKVTDSPGDIKKADKLVLPGVGAFGDAMDVLKERGLSEAIKKHIFDKKAFLGICLGMHLLFESSEESGGAQGLAIVNGSVKKFTSANGLKVPHMGWNQIKFKSPGCPLFKGMADGSSVYFCHSYYAQPKSADNTAATTEYGLDFASIISKENIFAMQFHPEKSQESGLRLIENFVRL